VWRDLKAPFLFIWHRLRSDLPEKAGRCGTDKCSKKTERGSVLLKQKSRSNFQGTLNCTLPFFFGNMSRWEGRRRRRREKGRENGRHDALSGT